MAYRLPRPGVLEIHSEGRRRAIWLIATFVLATLAAAAHALLTMGWRDELAFAFAIAAFGGGGIILLRRRGPLRVTSEGIERPGGSLPRAPSARIEKLRIDVRTEIPASEVASSNLRVGYTVDLVLERAGEEETIGILASPDESIVRRAGEAIALHMTWPLEDAIGDDLEIRSPDALFVRDERKPAPEEPPPVGVREIGRQGEAGLSLDGLLAANQRRLLPLIVASFASTGLMAAGLLFAFSEGLMAFFAPAAIVLADSVAIGVFLGMTRAREEISVAQGMLFRSLHLGPLRFGKLQLDLHEVTRVRVQTRHSFNRGCAVVSGDSTLRLGRALDEPALRWLEAWITSHLP